MILHPSIIFYFLIYCILFIIYQYFFCFSFLTSNRQLFFVKFGWKTLFHTMMIQYSDYFYLRKQKQIYLSFHPLQLQHFTKLIVCYPEKTLRSVIFYNMLLVKYIYSIKYRINYPATEQANKYTINPDKEGPFYARLSQARLS